MSSTSATNSTIMSHPSPNSYSLKLSLLDNCHYPLHQWQKDLPPQILFNLLRNILKRKSNKAHMTDSN